MQRGGRREPTAASLPLWAPMRLDAEADKDYSPLPQVLQVYARGSTNPKPPPQLLPALPVLRSAVLSDPKAPAEEFKSRPPTSDVLSLVLPLANAARVPAPAEAAQRSPPFFCF